MSTSQQKSNHGMFLYFILAFFLLFSWSSSINQKNYIKQVELFERNLKKYGIERLVSPEGHVIYMYDDKVVIK